MQQKRSVSPRLGTLQSDGPGSGSGCRPSLRGWSEHDAGWPVACCPWGAPPRSQPLLAGWGILSASGPHVPTPLPLPAPPSGRFTTCAHALEAALRSAALPVPSRCPHCPSRLLHYALTVPSLSPHCPSLSPPGALTAPSLSLTVPSLSFTVLHCPSRCPHCALPRHLSDWAYPKSWFHGSSASRASLPPSVFSASPQVWSQSALQRGHLADGPVLTPSSPWALTSPPADSCQGGACWVPWCCGQAVLSAPPCLLPHVQDLSACAPSPATGPVAMSCPCPGTDMPGLPLLSVLTPGSMCAAWGSLLKGWHTPASSPCGRPLCAPAGPEGLQAQFPSACLPTSALQPSVMLPVCTRASICLPSSTPAVPTPPGLLGPRGCPITPAAFPPGLFPEPQTDILEVLFPSQLWDGLWALSSAPSSGGLPVTRGTQSQRLFPGDTWNTVTATVSRGHQEHTATISWWYLEHTATGSWGHLEHTATVPWGHLEHTATISQGHLEQSQWLVPRDTWNTVTATVSWGHLKHTATGFWWHLEHTVTVSWGHLEHSDYFLGTLGAQLQGLFITAEPHGTWPVYLRSGCTSSHLCRLFGMAGFLCWL